MTDVQAAITGMLASRYSGQPTQRDLDVAEVAYAAGAAAEREAIIAIASELRATVSADHPKGAQASFADYLRVTRGGDPA